MIQHICLFIGIVAIYVGIVNGIRITKMQLQALFPTFFYAGLTAAGVMVIWWFSKSG